MKFPCKSSFSRWIVILTFCIAAVRGTDDEDTHILKEVQGIPECADVSAIRRDLNAGRYVLFFAYQKNCAFSEGFYPDIKEVQKRYEPVQSVVVHTTRLDCRTHEAALKLLSIDSSEIKTVPQVFFSSKNEEGEITSIKYSYQHKFAQVIAFLNAKTGARLSFTGLPLPSAGRYKEVEKMVNGRLSAEEITPELRSQVLGTLQTIVPTTNPFKSTIIAAYEKTMDRISSGKGGLQQELERLTSLIQSDSVSDARRMDLIHRANIARAFVGEPASWKLPAPMKLSRHAVGGCPAVRANQERERQAERDALVRLGRQAGDL